ncbi:UNVERIFIED_CONTAM: hypothetical protein FKN15_069729 [Acipenser sinensis]
MHLSSLASVYSLFILSQSFQFLVSRTKEKIAIICSLYANDPLPNTLQQKVELAEAFLDATPTGQTKTISPPGPDHESPDTSPQTLMILDTGKPQLGTRSSETMRRCGVIGHISPERNHMDCDVISPAQLTGGKRLLCRIYSYGTLELQDGACEDDCPARTVGTAWSRWEARTSEITQQK